MQLKYLLSIFIVLGLISFTSAISDGSFATIKLNDCVIIKQTCANCTSCNITSINNENSIEVLGLTLMTKNDTEYFYNFCKNYAAGVYTVNGKCNPDDETDIFQKQYEVTPSGYTGTLGFNLIFIGIGLFFIVLGFSIKDGWMTVLGSFFLFFIGLYTLLFGIDGIRNLTFTYAYSIIILGISSYIGINSAIEMLDEAGISFE